jgi:hypothetical protein
LPLRPGGHVNYWKDPEVLGGILNLIEERPIAVAPVAAAAEEDAPSAASVAAL